MFTNLHNLTYLYQIGLIKVVFQTSHQFCNDLYTIILIVEYRGHERTKVAVVQGDSMAADQYVDLLQRVAAVSHIAIGMYVCVYRRIITVSPSF